jgi:hypothetical protein
VKEPQLRSELLEREHVDQEAREALVQWRKVHASDAGNQERQAEFEALIAKLKAIDEDNTKWLKAAIENYGWLTNTLVGKDGANAAWLFVQHADHDPTFQRQCLDLMARLPKDEVSQQNLAYLTDRVLLAEGKKQLYGTQFTLVDGKWQPRPLEDEPNVDKRRAEVGLPPLAAYRRLIDKEYGAPRK